MAIAQIPEEVMNALVENTRVIDANSAVLASLSEKDSKETINEKNIVQKGEVKPNLTSDEKRRYANIGKELFSNFITSLDELIKRERNRAAMSLDDDTNNVYQKALEKYEKEKKKENASSGTNWVTVIMGLLGMAAVAINIFKDKIAEFFNSAWTWIKDTFSTIAGFFNFSNPENPIIKILKNIGDSIGSFWDFIKSSFSKLGEMGTYIWENLKEAWDKFITGPEGILSFGSKIIKSIIDFSKSAVSWIGDAISTAIIEPIKSIFSSAEDTGKEAGDDAAKEVKVAVNQAATEQAAKQKALADNVLFDAKKSNTAIEESAKALREDALKRANEQGIAVNAQGKLNEAAIKEAAAKAGLDAFINAKNIGNDFDKAEYEKYQKEFEKFVEINGNNANINMQKLQEHFAKLGENDSHWATIESDFIDSMQNIKSEDLDTINANVSNALQQTLQIQANLEAALNLENMSEEERFLARMQQAMQKGKTAEFRFMEGRSMILQSVEAIKEAFSKGHKVEVAITSPQDNSQNTYHITPINRESFKALGDDLIKIAQESMSALVSQNKVLDEIKVLLNSENNSNKQPAQPVIVNNDENKQQGSNMVSLLGRGLVSDLFGATTSFA